MRRKAIIAEAQRLIQQFGADACENARDLEREAKRRRNSRLAAFYGAVGRQIEKDIGNPEQLPGSLSPRAAHQPQPRSIQLERKLS